MEEEEVEIPTESSPPTPLCSLVLLFFCSHHPQKLKSLCHLVSILGLPSSSICRLFTLSWMAQDRKPWLDSAEVVYSWHIRGLSCYTRQWRCCACFSAGGTAMVLSIFVYAFLRPRLSWHSLTALIQLETDDATEKKFQVSALELALDGTQSQIIMKRRTNVNAIVKSKW